MKRRIVLVCLFYCFWRLQIYKDIAVFFGNLSAMFQFLSTRNTTLLTYTTLVQCKIILYFYTISEANTMSAALLAHTLLEIHNVPAPTDIQ